MHMDDQDWGGGFNESDPVELDDDFGQLDDEDDPYTLTLDAGEDDNAEDIDDEIEEDEEEDEDEDEDDENEDERELECVAEVITCGIQNIASGLSPAENTTILQALNSAASLGLPASNTDVLKAFYILVITRNKTTGTPFYSSSTIYNEQTSAVQTEIRNAIGTWDGASDTSLWGYLASALGDSSINSTALQLDLVTSAGLTQLVTNDEHTAVDNYITSWTTAAMTTLITGTLVGIIKEQSAKDAATFMKTFTVTGLGAPPFALGAQALQAAIIAESEIAYAQALDKCSEEGAHLEKCEPSGPVVSTD